MVKLLRVTGIIFIAALLILYLVAEPAEPAPESFNENREWCFEVETGKWFAVIDEIKKRCGE